MPSKKKITPKKKKPSRKLILPSLSDFEKLPLDKRQTLFERWVATQSGIYDFQDIWNCPLVQFGKAISGSRNVSAGSFYFRLRDRPYLFDVLEVLPAGEGSDSPEEKVISTAGSFEELAKRLRALRVSASLRSPNPRKNKMPQTEELLFLYGVLCPCGRSHDVAWCQTDDDSYIAKTCACGSPVSPESLVVVSGCERGFLDETPEDPEQF